MASLDSVFGAVESLGPKGQLAVAAGIGVALNSNRGTPDHTKHMVSGAIVGGSIGVLLGKKAMLPGVVMGGMVAGVASDISRKGNATVSVTANAFAGAFAVTTGVGSMLGLKMIRDGYLIGLKSELAAAKAASPIYNNILSRAGFGAAIGLLSMAPAYKLARKGFAVKNSHSFRTSNYAIGPSTVHTDAGSFSDRGDASGTHQTPTNSSAGLSMTGNITSSFSRIAVRDGFVR